MKPDSKAGLMSLISDVTGTKESVRQSKLDKHRGYNPPPPPQSGSNTIKVDPSKRKRPGASAAVEIVPDEEKMVKAVDAVGGRDGKVKKVKEKKEVPAAERRKREKERELVSLKSPSEPLACR